MGSLTVRTRREDDVVVVELDGELDVSSVDSLRAAVLPELAVPGTSRVVLDLARLSFLDSSGLGCWIDLRNQAEAAGASLELASVPAVTHRTLTIAGLAPLFGLPGMSRDEAAAAAARREPSRGSSRPADVADAAG